MLQTILFTDLDDTLFATARKQPPKKDFRAGSFLRDGSISGYLSPKQWQMWQIWQQHALIIPVTARNRETFSRVALPFSGPVVINHGGVILREDGTLDPEWARRQNLYAHEASQWLREQEEHLKVIAKVLQADVRLWINHDCDLDLYVLLKSNHGSEKQVAEIAQIYQENYLDISRGYIHCNGNNLAILPNHLNKAAAVEFLILQLEERFGELLTLGFGDSQSDLAFMRLCDYWLTPHGGQIDLLQKR